MCASYSWGDVKLTDPNTGELREIVNLSDVDWSHDDKDEAVEEVAEALAGYNRAMEFRANINLFADEFMSLFLGLTKLLRYRTGIHPKHGKSRKKQRLTRLQRRRKRQNKK